MRDEATVGSLELAISRARLLLRSAPERAAEQAREILKAVPGHPVAQLVLGAAHRAAGRTQEALALLEPLGREQPQAAPVHLELGVARAEAGDRAGGIEALRCALRLKPDSPDGWRWLADLHDAAGEAGAADQARARYLKAATNEPELLAAGAALVENRLPEADALLRAHLATHPTDVAALRMLAEVAARLQRYADAQDLLERCLELAPSFDAARHNYAIVLNRQAKAAQALPQIERLLAAAPRNPAYLNLKAAVLAQLGEYGESIEVYAQVLRDQPRQPKIWLSYGHALKTAGSFAQSVAAYRRALEQEPTLGEAYWSLANLKTHRFTDEEVAAMRRVIGRTELADEDRLHVEFALGRALEDRGQYPESFAHYRRANATRKRLRPYHASANHGFVRRSKAVFSPEFFAARASLGAPARDPIFIVGLPRAGSTLLEQILSSHSQIEGTMELPELPRIARELAGGDRDGDPEERFFGALAALDGPQLRALGERYLDATRVHRKTGRPFFIDKMPNNCLYLGLIHLILPRATIIDARRHPLGCCLSAFKQHFARGQNFTYDLADLGAYYRDYVELMAHMDAVLPGRAHRVFYEALVEDTEAEVRRLLAQCGLPFEAGCLRFYDNDRPVRTASSEQVRRPIYRDGVDHWRRYEPWLGPLKEALGSVLERYPQVPDFNNDEGRKPT